FSSRRRHTRFSRDWSSDVCSSDLRLAAMYGPLSFLLPALSGHVPTLGRVKGAEGIAKRHDIWGRGPRCRALEAADWGHNHRAPGAGRGSRVGAPGSTCLQRDRKSTRLNSSHVKISYAV